MEQLTAMAVRKRVNALHGRLPMRLKDASAANLDSNSSI
jgi:hypothetical protein